MTEYICNYCEISDDECGPCRLEVPEVDEHPTRCPQDGVVVPWREENTPNDH